ncbi:polymorphic toxin type 15 domain-containing protein, partial [Micromonospora provocatoris]
MIAETAMNLKNTKKLVTSAVKNAETRIKNVQKQLDNLAKISEEKLKQQALKTADSVDRLVTNMKNINLNPIEDVAFAGVGRLNSSVENTHTIRDMMSKIVKSSEKEINLGDVAKGTVKDSNGIKDLDNVTRISEVEVNFNYKTTFDSEEFTRQLKDQEKGMNELTVYEYQQNRKRFIEEGRAIESNAAQQAAR